MSEDELVTKGQLKEYLKANLRIRVDSDSQYGYGGDTIPTLKISILLGEDIISEANFPLPS